MFFFFFFPTALVEMLVLTEHSILSSAFKGALTNSGQ